MNASETFNIVLSLLFLWQWHKSYAKEQCIKNNLLGLRRVLNEEGKNGSLRELLDATLATIGARKPFVKEGEELLNYVLRKNKKTSKEKISQQKSNH